MTRIIQVLRIIGAAAIALTTARGADDPGPAREAMKTWIAANRGVKTLEIEFRQERKLKGLSKPLVTTGRIWLDRRGMMRWQMGEPAKTIAIYKQGDALVLQPAKKLAIRREPGAEDDKDASMEKAFLQTGTPDSLEDFEKYFRILGIKDEGGLRRVSAELLDQRARAAVLGMDFLLDANGRDLAGYDLSFRDGSSISTRVTRAERNPALDPALFSPSLDGYKVESLRR